jgi:hypothetical protein
MEVLGTLEDKHAFDNACDVVTLPAARVSVQKHRQNLDVFKFSPRFYLLFL